MSLEVTIIRHGETEYNRRGIVQGSMEVDLSQIGLQQSDALGEFLNREWSGMDIDAWFTSPQGRARQTSELIRKKLTDVKLSPEEPDDRLMEIRCGELEGRVIKEIDKDLLTGLKTRGDMRYPGGESILDVMGRAEKFKTDLMARFGYAAESEDVTRRVVVVAHGNLNRSMASVLMGMGPELALSIMQKNTGFSRFRCLPPVRTFRMISWNETPHLQNMED